VIIIGIAGACEDTLVTCAFRTSGKSQACVLGRREAKFAVEGHLLRQIPEFMQHGRRIISARGPLQRSRRFSDNVFPSNEGRAVPRVDTSARIDIGAFAVCFRVSLLNRGKRATDIFFFSPENTRHAPEMNLNAEPSVVGRIFARDAPIN